MAEAGIQRWVDSHWEAAAAEIESGNYDDSGESILGSDWLKGLEAYRERLAARTRDQDHWRREMQSKDAQTVARALLDLEAFMGNYLQPDDRDPDETLNKVIKLLDRRDVVAAATRIVAGYGLHVVK